MRITFADLWRPTGTIDRRTYALVGVLGFALKHNVDRLIATYAFHRPWGLFNYWEPVRDVARITALDRSEALFLATMVAVALPFIWLGVSLTLKRLRSAGLSWQLVPLFFVPVLNLFFFIFLSLIPSSNPLALSGELPRADRSFVERLMPGSAWGSAIAAVLITVPISFAMAVLGANILLNYGWGMFVALPFTMGFASAMVYGIRRPPSAGGYIGVACLSVTILGSSFLCLAFEGIFCLLMALPIALPLAAFGGGLAYCVQTMRWVRKDATAFLGAALLIVPGVQWTEHLVAPPPPTFVVRSAIEIHASPEEVWKQVVAFTEIPPPKEWIFRAGIAYPIRAEMLGTGVGAERHCVFSTGAFVEPIQVWDEPHMLKFSVTSNPAPMEEWTLYAHIDPPHLHGFLVSNGGQFLLTPLPNGRTRLEGTTWYHHRLWPSQYWQLWSDAIIHRIHMRVLAHIRDEADRKIGEARVGSGVVP